MVNATELQRPDRGTIGGSAGCRDYPMSMHVVLLERDRADEADDGGVVGEDADYVGAPLDLAVETFQRVGAVDLGAVLLGECCKGKHVCLGVIHQAGELGHPRAQLVGDGAPLCASGIGVVLGECRADPGRDDAPLCLAGMCQGIAHELDAAALPRGIQQATGRVVGQAKRFAKEIDDGVKRCTQIVRQTALEGHRQVLDMMVPRVQQVMRQAKARIFRGDTRSEGKIVSLFEPSTEVIRKGKASRPTEFGKLVKLQEAENQIIVDYEVYARRPNDSDLLMPAIEVHAAKLGCIPRLVAADAGFYSAKNEAAAKAKGVKRVCIPNRGSKSAARKREQKKRWFRNGQRWRTGCEGRISVSKRRHGLQRCRYRGDDGMRRWVGLGVIADNLINIGRAIAAEPAT